MAGGIDWFRWHHGSVNDPKFGLIAKKSGASVAEVIAVWACLLEQASTADDRGNPGDPDFEAIDYGLGMADGTAQRVYERMRERSLIDTETGRIAAWEKRQPKRERSDDNSSERVRAFRDKQRQDEPGNGAETPCNATKRQETPREEESREEEKPMRKPAAAPPGFDEFWAAYPRRRNRGDAEKAWVKLKPDASLQAKILQAVEVAKARDDWRKDGGQFVPYPASWLNAKGWQDDVAGEALDLPSDPDSWRRDPRFADVVAQ